MLCILQTILSLESPSVKSDIPVGGVVDEFQESWYNCIESISCLDVRA